MKTIIAIAGKKGSGKDLLGKFLMPKGYKRFAFGDIIRERVKRDFNLTDEQVSGCHKETRDTRWNVTPREIMERYGMFFRGFDKEYWIKELGWEIEKYVGDKIVITDVRLLSEVKFLKSIGAIVVRLEREPELRQEIYPGPESTAVTEVELDGYSAFDFVVQASNNRYAYDLKQFAKELLIGLK